MITAFINAIISGQVPFQAFCGAILIVVVVAVVIGCFVIAAIRSVMAARRERQRIPAYRRNVRIYVRG